MRFKEQVVVITGGGSGIGRTTALFFAKEGARVAVPDLNVPGGRETEQLIRDAGGEALFVEMNVTSLADCERMVSEVTAQWGRIDVLVNNAGIARDNLVLRMKEEEWDAVLDTNLKGAFLCTKAVLKQMLRQRSGRIINIASVMGQLGGLGQPNYSAAKAGLIAFTKSVAREVASRGILVNAVAPGFIETAMTLNLPDDKRQYYLENIPLGRYGSPEDVARVIGFLASEDASYLTGQVINVDGGMVMARC
ncbi:MAG: 3-oxoacyl-[acyl-carrier-protein] reductase [Armatimonadota bacterium]|nr:3-oxoacyl-[acyl-carrier-protein] reductase [Armatimonadota bacterium]